MKASGQLLCGKIVSPTVITTENEECVLFDIQLFEQRNTFAHLTINHAHHCGKATGGLRPRLIARETPRRIIDRNVKQPMRWGISQASKERAFRMGADEVHRSLMNHVGRILLALAEALAARKRYLLAGADEIGWVVRVGVHLIVVAKKISNPCFSGTPVLSRPPLPQLPKPSVAQPRGLRIEAIVSSSKRSGVPPPLTRTDVRPLCFPARKQQRVSAQTDEPARRLVNTIPSVAI